MKIPISIVSTKSGRFIAAVDLQQAQAFLEVEEVDPAPAPEAPQPQASGSVAAATPALAPPAAQAAIAESVNVQLANSNDSLHQENAALLAKLRTLEARLAGLPEV